MIQLSKLCMAYGDNILLKEVTLSIPKDRFIALLGNNGSGKSSFLKILDGTEIPSSGTVLIEQEPIHQQKDRARKLALVSSGRTIGAALYVREVLEMGRYPYVGPFGKLGKLDHAKIDEVVETCGVKDWLNRPIGQLSDGEFQKVMIARALIQETPYLLMDEPSSFLDVKQRNWLFRSLQNLENTTILMATHDVQEALEYCDAFLVFQEQKVVLFERKTEELLQLLNHHFQTKF